MTSEHRKAIGKATASNMLLELLYAKAPNSVRIKRIYELLLKQGASSDEVDAAIHGLKNDGVIAINARPLSKQSPIINEELRKRDSISLVEYPKRMPIKGEYHIGEASVVRLLSGDIVSGEDINEITEALKEYVDTLDRTFDERVQRETSRIYRQMIGIFGVFVSVFAILVISTDKMLRFSPDTFANDPLELLLKSAALFLPVGIVIGALIWIVTRGAKK